MAEKLIFFIPDVKKQPKKIRCQIRRSYLFFGVKFRIEVKKR